MHVSSDNDSLQGRFLAQQKHKYSLGQGHICGLEPLMTPILTPLMKNFFIMKSNLPLITHFCAESRFSYKSPNRIARGPSRPPPGHLAEKPSEASKTGRVANHGSNYAIILALKLPAGLPDALRTVSSVNTRSSSTAVVWSTTIHGFNTKLQLILPAGPPDPSRTASPGSPSGGSKA